MLLFKFILLVLLLIFLLRERLFIELLLSYFESVDISDKSDL